MATTLVTGEIKLPAGTESFSGAAIYVNLEDTGMMGMPAQPISQVVMRNASYDGAAIPFSLDGDMPEEGGHYNVSAHISMDGSDDISKGDYITKRGYSALQNGAPTTLALEVERV